MNLTPEQKIIGQENFQNVIGHNRRDFLKGAVAAGTVAGAGTGAMYFGYEKKIGDRLRVGIIGTGDEGGVLIGALNKDFIDVVAIADIRPYNVHRAFHGDHTKDETLKVRPGLMTKYGWKSEEKAKDHVKVYRGDYRELLANKDVEAVIIALPLHLHAEAAIAAMKAGKHVLVEKLMGHSIRECKEMGLMAAQSRTPADKPILLAVGHQRHYSILYDNAVDTISRGMIGDIHSIRAQWHRDNLPGSDTWCPPLPDPAMEALINAKKLDRDKEKGRKRDALTKQILQLQAQYKDRTVDAAERGYQKKILPNGTEISPLEELIRWRLWNRTGGGLMAELGSHQLDAAGIFISALSVERKKALPLNVSALGGRYLFPLDRECEDHVYCMYEFPGKDYDRNPNSIVGVTYSSINGNGFGGYGEVVLGTKGTLVLEREAEVMLFPTAGATTKVSVKDTKDGPTLDTTATGGGEAAALGKIAVSGPVSRGYTEEIEHWAWCIRNPDKDNKPRCHPEVALGDAVIALTTNIAIRENRRIEFNKDWFKIDSPATPEGKTPDLHRYS